MLHYVNCSWKHSSLRYFPLSLAPLQLDVQEHKISAGEITYNPFLCPMSYVLCSSPYHSYNAVLRLFSLQESGCIWSKGCGGRRRGTSPGLSRASLGRVLSATCLHRLKSRNCSLSSCPYVVCRVSGHASEANNNNCPWYVAGWCTSNKINFWRRRRSSRPLLSFSLRSKTRSTVCKMTLSRDTIGGWLWLQGLFV